MCAPHLAKERLSLIWYKVELIYECMKQLLRQLILTMHGLNFIVFICRFLSSVYYAGLIPYEIAAFLI
jgi:hypothetical protein